VCLCSCAAVCVVCVLCVCLCSCAVACVVCVLRVLRVCVVCAVACVVCVACIVCVLCVQLRVLCVVQSSRHLHILCLHLLCSLIETKGACVCVSVSICVCVHACAPSVEFACIPANRYTCCAILRWKRPAVGATSCLCYYCVCQLSNPHQIQSVFSCCWCCVSTLPPALATISIFLLLVLCVNFPTCTSCNRYLPAVGTVCVCVCVSNFQPAPDPICISCCWYFVSTFPPAPDTTGIFSADDTVCLSLPSCTSYNRCLFCYSQGFLKTVTNTL